jgi:predicted NAD/FAD-binding protein
MPKDINAPDHRRIAVVGAGVSGMGAAHALAACHRVTLFEAEPRLGGHARTVIAGKRGDQPVDMGFIVFNYATYPELTRLFAELGVPVAKSNMGFAASLDGGRMEYALNSLNALVGQRSNIVDPRFWRMVRDILHFNARGEALATDDTLTIGGLLEQLGTGPRFRDHYILPFSGAIWSTPTRDILDFPAAAMLRFFRNHALLGANGQHQWYTVRGGSIEYVRRLETAMLARGVDIRLGAPMERVERHHRGVRLKVRNAEWEAFDEVVIATHTDQALAILGDADSRERRDLGAIRYQPNRAVLHADASMMPRRRRCWASWNYTEAAGPKPDAISLTYWMNSLQPIPKDDPLFVTLNPTRPIREDLVHDAVTFAHPMYDAAALAAQRNLAARNGARNTWFCGAWMKNGFHEDGYSSALDVARAIDAQRSAEAA